MNPAEAVPPAETPPGAAKPVESPAKPPAEIVIPAATSMAPPSVEARAETVKSASSENLGDFGREAFAALVQSQTAVARGLEALSAELAGLALSGIDAAARTATDMLRVKTLADAIEVHTGFTRSSFDTLVDGSAKLSELGTKLAAEASQPILTQLGKGWIKATRFAF
jgi:phasin family protein